MAAAENTTNLQSVSIAAGSLESFLKLHQFVSFNLILFLIL